MPGFRCRNEGFDSLTPERSRRLAAPPRGDRRSDKPEEVGGDVGLASRFGEENAIARKDEITNRPGELVEVDLRRYSQNCLVCHDDSLLRALSSAAAATPGSLFGNLLVQGRGFPRTVVCILHQLNTIPRSPASVRNRGFFAIF